MTLRRRDFLGSTLAGVAGLPMHGSAAASAPSMKHGWNVSAPTYYDGSSLYINRLLESAVSGDTTANGYPAGGAGKTTTYLVISENAYEWWAYKPGVYRIRGIGTGARVQVSGIGFKEQTLLTSEGTPFRISVTVPPMAAPADDAAASLLRGQHLRLAVSGGNAPMTELAVFHADDEADFAAGKTFTAEARADLATASRGPVRPMGLMQTVAGWVKDVSDLPADDTIGPTNYFSRNRLRPGAQPVPAAFAREARQARQRNRQPVVGQPVGDGERRDPEGLLRPARRGLSIG